MIRIILLAIVAFLIPSTALAASVWSIGGSDGDAVRTLRISEGALVNDFSTPMLGCRIMNINMTYLGTGAQIAVYATDVDSTPTVTEIEADILLDVFDLNDSMLLNFAPKRQELRFVVDTVSTKGDTVLEIECINYSAEYELRDNLDANFRQFSIMVKDPVTADIWGLFKAPRDLTISAIECIVEGTSAVMSVVEGTATSMSGAGIDGATTILCDVNGQADDGDLSNPTVDQGDWISLLFGAETATQIVVTVFYSFD